MRIRQQRATQMSRPAEWHRSKDDPAYFIHEYTMIFNATNERWEPFSLWPAQRDVLGEMQANRQLIVLKARQLGLTWLTLAYLLWRMLFYPAATVGIFSQRETDAADLLASRLKGMYDRLPDWAKAGPAAPDSKTEWRLPNGSVAMAFPTTGGRSYTFSHLLIDEADFQPDLPLLLSAVEPTIDAGGQMLMISTVDKKKPESRFKITYRAAKAGYNNWQPVFLPWWARPERTPAWYANQKEDTLANTGSLDDLYEDYPATDTEALASRTLDKRIPAPWIEACYREVAPVDDPAAPSIPGLTVYEPPHRMGRYVIGADPAEGNPTSDDSALTVTDMDTGEEMAALAGKFEPSVFADYIDQIGRYYNGASAMVERNNHGHAVILWLEQNGSVPILCGPDGKMGWLSNALGKSRLYTAGADAFRHGNTVLHSFATYMQLMSIDGSTLRAPEGEHDDRADSFVLAEVGRTAEDAREVAITW